MCKFLGSGLHQVVSNSEGYDANVRWRYRQRPYDALVIMVLLYDGRERTGHAHAIAAHDERFFRAVFIHERSAHALGVLRAELEYLRHLDSAGAFQFGSAFRACIARLDLAEIGPFVDLEIDAVAGAGEVETVLVGADCPLIYVFQVPIGDNAYALRQADWSHRALEQARCFHFLVSEKLEVRNDSVGFDVVELVVSRNEEHDDVAVGVFDRKGLHARRLGNVEERR